MKCMNLDKAAAELEAHGFVFLGLPRIDYLLAGPSAAEAC